MPYYVDQGPGALGFAAAYLQGKQQRRKDDQQYALDMDKANQQAQLTDASLASSAASTQGQTLSNNAVTASTDQQAKMAAWDALHPAPDVNDIKAFGKYVSARVSYANSIGDTSAADKTMSDFRTGQMATQYGANAAYTSGAKTTETNAKAKNLDANTQFQIAHASNEKGRYAHDLAMIKQKDGDAAARQVEVARMRIGAQLQAASMRSGTSLQIAGMNNETREAISMRAAIISQQTGNEKMGLQEALAEYKGQEQEYLAAHKQNANGTPAYTGLDVPDIQTGASGPPPAPTFNINAMPGGAQQPQPQIVIMQVPVGNGQTVPVPHVVYPKPPHHNPALNPHAAQPQQQPNWAQSLLHNIQSGVGSWLTH